MSVAVDICNSALIKLGADRINALTDDNRSAKLCNEQYEKVKNKVLRSHPWTFAVKRALLAPTPVTPQFGGSGSGENFFTIPADSIRLLSINDTTPYCKEGPYLVTTLAEVKLHYISKDIPEAYFDEDFKEALACAIAADLCYAITQSNTLKQSLMQECEKWISEARSYGSQEVTVEGLQFDEWDNSRRVGRAVDIDIMAGPKL
jgi:hypothetical protein